MSESIPRHPNELIAIHSFLNAVEVGPYQPLPGRTYAADQDSGQNESQRGLPPSLPEPYQPGFSMQSAPEWKGAQADATIIDSRQSHEQEDPGVWERVKNAGKVVREKVRDFKAQNAAEAERLRQAARGNGQSYPNPNRTPMDSQPQFMPSTAPAGWGNRSPSAATPQAFEPPSQLPIAGSSNSSIGQPYDVIDTSVPGTGRAFHPLEEASPLSPTGYPYPPADSSLWLHPEDTEGDEVVRPEVRDRAVEEGLMQSRASDVGIGDVVREKTHPLGSQRADTVGASAAVAQRQNEHDIPTEDLRGLVTEVPHSSEMQDFIPRVEKAYQSFESNLRQQNHADVINNFRQQLGLGSLPYVSSIDLDSPTAARPAFASMLSEAAVMHEFSPDDTKASGVLIAHGLERERYNNDLLVALGVEKNQGSTKTEDDNGLAKTPIDQRLTTASTARPTLPDSSWLNSNANFGEFPNDRTEGEEQSSPANTFEDAYGREISREALVLAETIFRQGIGQVSGSGGLIDRRSDGNVEGEAFVRGQEVPYGSEHEFASTLFYFSGGDINIRFRDIAEAVDLQFGNNRLQQIWVKAPYIPTFIDGTQIRTYNGFAPGRDWIQYYYWMPVNRPGTPRGGEGMLMTVVVPPNVANQIDRAVGTNPNLPDELFGVLFPSVVDFEEIQQRRMGNMIVAHQSPNKIQSEIRGRWAATSLRIIDAMDPALPQDLGVVPYPQALPYLRQEDIFGTQASIMQSNLASVGNPGGEPRDDYDQNENEGFGYDEVAKFLSNNYPLLSNESVSEIHRLSLELLNYLKNASLDEKRRGMLIQHVLDLYLGENGLKNPNDYKPVLQEMLVGVDIDNKHFLGLDDIFQEIQEGIQDMDALLEIAEILAEYNRVVVDGRQGQQMQAQASE